MTTWLIKGCSTGLGRSLAQAVLEAGFNAVVTSRQPQVLEERVSAYSGIALAAALDVTDKGQVESAVKLAESRFRAVDVLVKGDRPAKRIDQPVQGQIGLGRMYCGVLLDYIFLACR